MTQVWFVLSVVINVISMCDSATLNCMTSTCSPRELRQLQAGRFSELVISDDLWDQMIHPQHTTHIKSLWFRSSKQNSRLYLNRIVFKCPSLIQIHLFDILYSSVQIPISYRKNQHSSNIKNVYDLNLQFITADVLDWLGELTHLTMILNDLTWSRLPQLRSIGRLYLKIPQLVNLGSILGSDCTVKSLSLEVPKVISILPHALCGCKRLQDLYIFSPLMNISQCSSLLENHQLVNLTMSLRKWDKEVSLSEMICSSQSQCLLDYVDIRLDDNIPRNILGSKIRTVGLALKANESVSITAFKPGMNLKLDKLSLNNT